MMSRKEGRLLLLLLLLLVVAVTASDSYYSAQDIMKRTLPAYDLALTSSRVLSKSGNEVSCRTELDVFKRAVDRRVLWAIKMLDASGEPKPGFVYGNNYWLGSRSQCLDTTNHRPFVLKDSVMLNNTRLRDPRDEYPPYRVNYFVAYFRHNATIQYHVRLPNEDLVTLGLCLPSSCTTEELGLILDQMFQERSLVISDMFTVDFKLERVKDMQDDHKWLLSARVIFIMFLLIVLIVLLITGTFYDFFVWQNHLKREKIVEVSENNNGNFILLNIKGDNVDEVGVAIRKEEPNTWIKVLLCFSVYTNTKVIFTTELNRQSVAPIHGLRFLGMMWIIMIHTIFYMSDFADNKTWSWRMAEGFAVSVISNSTLSVDTFFFLSGFLVAYMYYVAHKNDRPTKTPNYRLKVLEFSVMVVRRFIRLTPAYMMMVGILLLNSNWYARTSQFHIEERPHETCAKYWWRNLLYINNLFGRETMCMSWSWYLSNDMQFFIIGVFLLILSSVYFYAAVTILFLLLIGSITLTGYISYIYKHVPTMDQEFHMLDVLYDPPWTRIGPYIVGMITAYIITRLNGKLPMRRKTVAAGWILGSLCNLIVLFGLCKRQISVLMAALYAAFSRTVWAIGLAWLLIACCTKHGGLVNKILCFKAWIPLSRLTYCAYLLNPFLIYSIYLHSESAVHVDFLPNGSVFLGIFMATYVCSYGLSLLLETPTVLLMRNFINIRRR